MNVPKLIRAILDQPEPIPEEPTPSKAVQVTGQQVFDVLNTALPSAPHIYISDSQYWLCSKEDIENILKFNAINKEVYVTEKHDCDDFSYQLMGDLSDENWSGAAVGIIWTELHAFNLFIDENLKLWFIEPQSNQLYESLQDYTGKEIQFVIL